MEITLQYFDDCPHWTLARDRLREAMGRLGLDERSIRYQPATTPEQSNTTGFRGSPTVLFDGRDPFDDGPTAHGLACRMYRTPTGLDGAPTVEQLLDALASGSS